MDAPSLPTERGLAVLQQQQGGGVNSGDLDFSPVLRELQATFSSGKTHDIAWRKQQIARVRDLVTENSDAICEAIAKDLSRPRTEAFLGEVVATLVEVKCTLKNLDAWVKPKSVSHPLTQKPGHSLIMPKPKGVALIIGPWNFPVCLVLNPLIGAIAAGCCAVIKPSEVSTHSSKLVQELVEKYLDRDAVRVIPGRVPETTALLRLRWDHIFYTGNGAVARIIMTAAARHLTPVTLELGGKSPVVVDDDVDVDIAAKRILSGKFMNNGQVCIAPDFVLVKRGKESELIEAFKKTIIDFYGANPKESDSLGRMINKQHFARIASLLSEQDGKIILGGLNDADESSCYIPPTLLSSPTLNNRIMQEEIFGPLLPIIPVDSLSEATDIINSKETPLALYVFSNNEANIKKVLDATNSGGSCVNDTLFHIANPNLPFGGVGPSGTGSYHGKASFDTFSHMRSVMHRGTWLDPSGRYPPYDDSKLEFLKRLLIGPLLPPVVTRLMQLGLVGAAAYLVQSRM